MTEKKEQIKYRCVRCNSTFGYLKVKTKEWQCRACGHIEAIKKEGNE